MSLANKLRTLDRWGERVGIVPPSQEGRTLAVAKEESNLATGQAPAKPPSAAKTSPSTVVFWLLVWLLTVVGGGGLGAYAEYRHARNAGASHLHTYALVGGMLGFAALVASIAWLRAAERRFEQGEYRTPAALRWTRSSTSTVGVIAIAVLLGRLNSRVFGGFILALLVLLLVILTPAPFVLRRVRASRERRLHASDRSS